MPICGQMDIKGKDTSGRGSLNWRKKPRRVFTPAQRLAMVRECEAPGVSVAEVARRNQVNANLLFKWRRQPLRGQLPVVKATTASRARFLRWPQTATGTISLSAAQLSMLLEGIDWRRARKMETPQYAA